MRVGRVTKEGSGPAGGKNEQSGLSREDGEQHPDWVGYNFWEAWWEQGGAGFSEPCKSFSSEIPCKCMRYVWHMVRNLTDHR